ncbi:MAG: hypothetical protein ACRDPC_04525 [Solirubrobacteraceae bacterium]
MGESCWSTGGAVSSHSGMLNSVVEIFEGAVTLQRTPTKANSRQLRLVENQRS